MAITRAIGRLVYRSQGTNTGRLCYRESDGKLIYSRVSGEDIEDAIVVTISWGSNGKDLDICGHWYNSEDCIGWSWGTNVEVNGNVAIWDSGDDVSVAGTERVYLLPGSSPKNFLLHFNYYGHSDEYSASVCSVKVEYESRSYSLSNVSCGTESGTKAQMSDSGVRVNINSSGLPTGLTRI